MEYSALISKFNQQNVRILCRVCILILRYLRQSLPPTFLIMLIFFQDEKRYKFWNLFLYIRRSQLVWQAIHCHYNSFPTQVLRVGSLFLGQYAYA